MSIAQENADPENRIPANLAAPEKEAPESSCWAQLNVVCLFEWVLNTRVALFCMGFLALTPVLDILTDVLAAANYFWEGHVWWGTATLAIIYMSSRFTVLFLALLPMPDTRNLFWLYVPGLWYKTVAKPRGPLVTNDLESPQSTLGGVIDIRGGAEGKPPGGENNQQDVVGESQGDNRDLKQRIRSKFTDVLEQLLKDASRAGRKILPGVEIILIPISCLAIIPISTTAYKLACSYFKASVRGCCRSRTTPTEQRSETDAAPSNGETPTHMNSAPGSQQVRATSNDEQTERDKRLSRKLQLYLQTVSIVEALLESVPQIALQVRVGFFGGELTQWVFIMSVSISAFCVLKAMVTFLWRYDDIRGVLENLQKQYVVRFQVRSVGSSAPSGEGWGIATAAEVADNLELITEEKSGMGEVYIADLADGMEVGGARYMNKVQQRGGFGGGHILYSYK